MDKFIIIGGNVLEGEIYISGSKNAALPILMATLLIDNSIVINNVPKLSDITTTINLLKGMGAIISINGNSSSIEINTRMINNGFISQDLIKSMRASILVLGPLLSRYGKAIISLPGGCAIGLRPIDQHLKAIKTLGANVITYDEYIEVSINGRLKGAEIILDMITVTGTENILMASVLAKGKTIIRNAAKEPEVCDLANFLNKMGAKITGIGTNTLIIDGVDNLYGGEYTISPDRIEAGTYLIAGVITKGRIKLYNVDPSVMTSILNKLNEAGATIIIGKDYIVLDMFNKRPKAVNIYTAPYPNFPTDMQAQFLALNCVANGTSSVIETIFENRFMHVNELKRLGANIKINDNTAIIKGQNFLFGNTVKATDLRASASLVLAGLFASGKTIIENIYHIDRGYESIEEKLSKIGAIITREPYN